MQIKVNDTRMHKVKDAFCQVAEGKLILVGDEDSKDKYVYDKVRRYLKPIIISETEKIEEGDDVLFIGETVGPFITKCQPGSVLAREGKSDKWFKILALPEHFSPKHLQAIVDGKMKDGDKVLVECKVEQDLGCADCGDPDTWSIPRWNVIKLNPTSHITLHKIQEKMYTRDDVHKIVELAWATASAYGMSTGSADFEDWFEQNVK